MVTDLVYNISRLLCIYLQVTGAFSQENMCPNSNGAQGCCSGFYEENNTCHECVESYGSNCSTPCPQGFYGPQCRIECPRSCSANKCHKKLGCLEECVGSFGSNCSTTCPQGFYGPNCSFECPRSCSANKCHKTLGCLEENVNFFKNLKLHHWVVIAVLVVLIFVVVACYIVTPSNRRVRKRQPTERNDYIDQAVPQPASAYLGMSVTPCASTAYPEVSFQTKPIDNATEYV